MTPEIPWIAFLIVCGVVCLVLGALPKPQPYSVKTGMLCFQQRRELTVCRGVGLGLLAGVLAWFPVQAVFKSSQNLNSLVSFVVTAFLIPWVFLVWKSLDLSQDIGEVRFKLRKLVRVAAGVGVALTLFIMSLIPSGQDSTRTVEEGSHAAEAVRNR
jgi:hypothetical protein